MYEARNARGRTNSRNGPDALVRTHSPAIAAPKTALVGPLAQRRNSKPAKARPAQTPRLADQRGPPSSSRADALHRPRRARRAAQWPHRSFRALAVPLQHCGFRTRARASKGVLALAFGLVTSRVRCCGPSRVSACESSCRVQRSQALRQRGSIMQETHRASPVTSRSHDPFHAPQRAPPQAPPRQPGPPATPGSRQNRSIRRPFPGGPDSPPGRHGSAAVQPRALGSG